MVDNTWDTRTWGAEDSTGQRSEQKIGLEKARNREQTEIETGSGLNLD
jgi:hypothetical protein